MLTTVLSARSWKQRFLLILSCIFLFSGCDTLSNGLDDLFGKSSKPPIAGKRISILLNERSITPDPRVSTEQILLPAPSVNLNWPQSGGSANHAMHHIAVGDSLEKVWQADIGEGASKAL